MRNNDYSKSAGKIPARYRVDKATRIFFTICGWLAALMIVLILWFIIMRGIRVFFPSYPEQQNLGDFLTGMRWRADQQDYGVGFIIINTFITAIGAAILAFPVAVLSALLITKIAPPKLRAPLTTLIELLAAVPSVVFGVFASGVITEMVDNLAQKFGMTTFGGNSMLAVIILLAIMIYPTITALAIVSIQAVPRELELGSLALGATNTQTHFKVVLKSARTGIVTGLILGLGRAFGEATAVSMVAGNAFTGPTWNLFDITRTLTSTMLSGMHETTGVDYDIRFTVGMVLMIVMLITNLSIHAVRKHMEKKGQRG